MATISVTQARNDLFSVMDDVLDNGRITISSKKGNAVLISEEEWEDIMETLYILSDPDILSAAREARETPTKELEAADWRNIL